MRSGRLADARQNAYNVLTVNVEDIYAQYSDGVFDAQAIWDYLTEAIQGHDENTLGTLHILLVGDDNWDYYQGPGKGKPVSFIPTLYTQTYSSHEHAPADPLYTDANNDRVPDAAIGRLTVNSVDELNSVIDKTLNRTFHDGKTLFAADYVAGEADYGELSNGFAQMLHQSSAITWPTDKVTRAFLKTQSTSQARAATIDNTINNGVDLVSYFGHANPNRWTFSGLYSTTNVDAPENDGNPTIVLQWSCWSALFTNPDQTSMSEAFLRADSRGAAAASGATGLTSVSTDILLANQVFPRIGVPGTTIGEALLEAKQAIAGSSPGSHEDVILGWILDGDPALTLVH